MGVVKRLIMIVSKTIVSGSNPDTRAENIMTKARSRSWWSGGETRRSVETIKDGYYYVFQNVNFSTHTAVRRAKLDTIPRSWE